MKQKAFFIIFKGFTLKQRKQILFGRLESDFKETTIKILAKSVPLKILHCHFSCLLSALFSL